MISSVKTILAIMLFMMSASSLADKIVIIGKPTTLEPKNHVYYLPHNYSVDTPYHYVTIDNEQKICYAKKQSNLAQLTPQVIAVTTGENAVNWICYPADKAYFKIQAYVTFR